MRPSQKKSAHWLTIGTTQFYKRISFFRTFEFIALGAFVKISRAHRGSSTDKSVLSESCNKTGAFNLSGVANPTENKNAVTL